MRSNLQLMPIKKNPKKPTDFECQEVKPNNIIEFIENHVKKDSCPEHLRSNIFDSLEVYKMLDQPKHFEMFYRNSPATQILYPCWWRFNKMYN